jgi:carbonic anhydrase
MKHIKLGLVFLIISMAMGVHANEPILDLAAELEAHMAAQEKERQGVAPAETQAEPKPTPKPLEEEASAADKKKEVPVALAIPAVEPEPAKWSYQGETSPRFWHRLDPSYLGCATGAIQSPINLSSNQAINAPTMPGLDVVYRSVPLRLIHDHQGLRSDYPLGSFIRLDNQRFELTHYRFRTPSEHYLEGFAYPMEIQFFHRDGEGRQLVVSVLVQEGRINPALATILDNLPKEKESLHLVEDLNFNPVRFLPESKHFYRYLGSLTTPPCTEGVIWIVFQQPIEASIRQLFTLHQLTGENTRPIQSLNGRLPLKSWLRDASSGGQFSPPTTPGYFFDF